MQPWKRHVPDFPPGRQRNLGQKPAAYSRKLPPYKCIIRLGEYKAVRELKEDQSRVVLTADKGVAMVVMDRENYTDKAQLFLADTNT